MIYNKNTVANKGNSIFMYNERLYLPDKKFYLVLIYSTIHLLIFFC